MSVSAVIHAALDKLIPTTCYLFKMELETRHPLYDEMMARLGFDHRHMSGLDVAHVDMRYVDGLSYPVRRRER